MALIEPPGYRLLGIARRPFWVVAGTFTLFAGLVGAWMLVQVGGAKLTSNFDDLAELVAALAGGVACLVAAARARGRLRRAWRLIGAGALAWAAGQAVWSWYEVVANRPNPFPSVADVGFLCAVPLILVGVISIPGIRHDGLARTRFILDGLVLGASLLAVSWGTVLGATYHASGLTRFAEGVSLAYPIGDVATVTAALSILAHTGRRFRIPLGLVIAGMCALAVSDSAFVYLQQTTNYTSASLLDEGWVIGFLLLGLAGLWRVGHPQPGTEGERGRSWWQVALPYTLLFTAVGYIAVRWVHDRHLSAFLVVNGLCIFIFVLLRQVVTLFEDARLTRRLEGAVATLRRNESLLSYQAVHDPLTGLGNRAYFAERISAALARPHEPDHSLAVLLCDLDHFKDANDTLGHSVGDAILVAVSQRLLASVREGDSVARVGGDEFAIVLDDVTGPDQASGIAIRIVDAMRIALETASKDCLINISVGVSFRPFDNVSVEELLREADVALYAAKAAGGDSYRLFESRMGEAHFERLAFQSELAVGLERGEFFLEYEPIVCLETGHSVGVEALLRWQHPTRGVLPPNEFLQVAERSGAIVPIGQWALDRSLAQLHQWRTHLGRDDLWISVNLSPSQLVTGEFMTTVVEALEANEIEPGSLRLELTENALVEKGDASVDLLYSLRSLGVHITIDDFGTGYSSLTYLRAMPFDTLKVDRSFVGGLGVDEYDALIVDSVVKLAHARGIEVVAEGIEDSRQLELLRELGCDFGQGFHWSRSKRAEDLEALLAREPAHAEPTGDLTGGDGER